MTKYDDYDEFQVQRDDPLIVTCKFPIGSTTNRIRSYNGSGLIAVMTEDKELIIMDIEEQLKHI